jgi:hypothetical protein
MTNKPALLPIQRSHKTLRERYGEDHYRKIAAKGGAAPHKRRGFSDSEVAKKAAKKRWKKYSKSIDTR